MTIAFNKYLYNKNNNNKKFLIYSCSCIYDNLNLEPWTRLRGTKVWPLQDYDWNVCCRKQRKTGQFILKWKINYQCFFLWGGEVSGHIRFRITHENEIWVKAVKISTVNKTFRKTYSYHDMSVGVVYPASRGSQTQEPKGMWEFMMKMPTSTTELQKFNRPKHVGEGGEKLVLLW